MAKVFISEYADLPLHNGQIIPVGNEPAIAEQVVAIGGSSAQSAAFNDRTKWVRVHTDAICSLKFGANPTAGVDTPRMGANSTEFFGVRPNDKLAVITNT
jgi:hypothetical protein